MGWLYLLQKRVLLKFRLAFTKICLQPIKVAVQKQDYTSEKTVITIGDAVNFCAGP